jgi:hypothetical protein
MCQSERDDVLGAGFLKRVDRGLERHASGENVVEDYISV